LVIVDGQGEGSAQRIVYGLVDRSIARVGVLESGGRTFLAEATTRPELPGRYFSLVVPNEGQVELVGFDQSGSEIARIGSLKPPEHLPTSHDEAVAQGDPSGFAPTATPAAMFEYRGEPITPEAAAEQDLKCIDSLREVVCYDSIEELNASEGARYGSE
jgi:hypothetical protein